jgi:hypothetical protein
MLFIALLFLILLVRSHSSYFNKDFTFSLLSHMLALILSGIGQELLLTSTGSLQFEGNSVSAAYSKQDLALLTCPRPTLGSFRERLASVYEHFAMDTVQLRSSLCTRQQPLAGTARRRSWVPEASGLDDHVYIDRNLAFIRQQKWQAVSV